jgi:DNA-binding transcriptional MerR regulator
VKPLQQKVYQIDEVSVQTGLTKRTLRYYEDLELITPLRTESGYRVYTAEDIDKIKQIIEIKDVLGFRLIDIKDILELRQNLAHIFDDSPPDITLVEQSLAMMAKQMALVEEKERSLARVAAKYHKTYEDLNQVYNRLKAEVNQDEKDKL